MQRLSMQRLAWLFVALCGLLLTVIPAANLVLMPQPIDAGTFTRKRLFNTDFIWRFASRLAYPMGISLDPRQVVIGRDGWLYLGDMYQANRTVDRRGKQAQDLVAGQRVGAALSAWKGWMEARGVSVFAVMLAPNKSSIYPEHLPRWAMPVVPSAMDGLLEGVDRYWPGYINLRPALQEARPGNAPALFFRFDTHWNALGAALGYRAFAERIGPLAPALRWPSASAYEVVRINPRAGGDLTNFLRMSDHLVDESPVVALSEQAVQTVRSDFDSGTQVGSGDNPEILSPNTPLLVRTDGALNRRRVLWLRDSFGTSMAPWMAATFSDVLQLHWEVAFGPDGRLAGLIEDWKPDYVFVTVVERAARSERFMQGPPLVVSGAPRGFQARTTPMPAQFNSIERLSDCDQCRVAGPDPRPLPNPATAGPSLASRMASSLRP